MKSCRCGCNQEIPFRKSHKYDGIPDYINGHNARGMKYTRTDKTKRRLSLVGNGRVASKETRKKEKTARESRE